MSAEQVVFVVLMVSLAAFALAGAFAARRALGRAGDGLRRMEIDMHALADALPNRFDDARDRLADIDAQADNTLGTLDGIDTRIDQATSRLRASRIASDTLRLRLIEGRITIAQMRQLVRALMRIAELRRDFL